MEIKPFENKKEMYLKENPESKIILFIAAKLFLSAFPGITKAPHWMASALHNAGYGSIVVDSLSHEKPLEIIERILEERNVGAVVVAGTMAPQLNSIEYLVKDIHQLICATTIPLIVGGWAAEKVHRLAQLIPEIDYWCYGDGLETIVLIARAVNGVNGATLDSIRELPGVQYHDKKTNIFVKNAKPQRMTGIEFSEINQNYGFDQVYTPYCLALQNQKWGIFENKKTAQLMLNIGCYNNCGFCTSGQNLGVIKLDRVSMNTQLDKLQEHGVEAIYCDQDNFATTGSEFLEFVSEFNSRKMVCGGQIRVDLLYTMLQKDPELLNKLAKLGLRYLFCGVESVVDGVIDAVDKIHNRNESKKQQAISSYQEQVQFVFQKMKEAGLPSSYFIIIGLPKKVNGEFVPTDLNDFIETVQTGLSAHVDYINVNILRLITGSAFSNADNPASRVISPYPGEEIDAAYFSNTGIEHYNIRRQVCPAILCFFEALNQNDTQPYSFIGEDGELIHKYVTALINEINDTIEKTSHITKMFVPDAVTENKLLFFDPSKGKYGQYILQPNDVWENSREKLGLV
jgi:anaerobic magnesium-protoporphyrin IX monomethyl ester cyclase